MLTTALCGLLLITALKYAVDGIGEGKRHKHKKHKKHNKKS